MAGAHRKAERNPYNALEMVSKHKGEKNMSGYIVDAKAMEYLDEIFCDAKQVIEFTDESTPPEIFNRVADILANVIRLR